MPYSFQRVAAAILLAGVSPLLVAVAVAIALADGRPVLYRGERVGEGGRRFSQLKFRSMVVDADKMLTSIEANAPAGRVTTIGTWIRLTSIDELPQLWNVVRGEMALIGPRPLLPALLDRIPEDHPRFAVLPGLTGLAQVEGRNEVPWSTRLELDAKYAATRSLSVDLRVLRRTVSVVLGSRGVAGDRNPSQVLDI